VDAALGVLLGIGLAAACGFRIFVPFLVLSTAALGGHVPLADGFQWIGTPVALTAFALATLLEVGAYFLPWLDNLLDALATPVTVIAGMVAVAAVATELPPALRWTVAMIAGGGVAGVVQGGSVLARATSTLATGGLGNVAVSGLELVGSVVASLTAVLLPLLGGLLAIVVAVAALRMILRRRRRAPAVE
jgi:hypothetical protein